MIIGAQRFGTPTRHHPLATLVENLPRYVLGMHISIGTRRYHDRQAMDRIAIDQRQRSTLT